MTAMTRISSAEFQRTFGQLSDTAIKHPITITKHGRDHLVLLSAEKYAHLAQRHHRVESSAKLAVDDRENMHKRREALEPAHNSKHRTLGPSRAEGPVRRLSKSIGPLRRHPR